MKWNEKQKEIFKNNNKIEVKYKKLTKVRIYKNTVIEYK